MCAEFYFIFSSFIHVEFTYFFYDYHEQPEWQSRHNTHSNTRKLDKKDTENMKILNFQVVNTQL